jgi:putative phage-type endonuclease
MDKSNFLKERRSGVGGSDVHHVFSLEPWGCARRLWYEKRGVEPDYPRDEGGVLRRGTLLEPLVAEEYARATGREVETVGRALHHKEHRELLVHVDRLIAPDADAPVPEEMGVLEIKTANREMFYKLKREGLPHAYILQLQHGMMVAGCQWGAFAVLWPDQWKLLHWDVAGDPMLQSAIRTRCLEFWQIVQDGTQPEQLPAKDKRCARCEYRTSCQGKALLEAVGDHEDGDVPFDGALTDLAAQYLELRDIRDEADEQLGAIKDALHAALDQRTAVDATGARIYYRPVTSMRWDTRALGKDRPELAEKYKKPSVSRPLRVFAK